MGLTDRECPRSFLPSPPRPAPPRPHCRTQCRRDLITASRTQYGLGSLYRLICGDFWLHDLQLVSCRLISPWTECAWGRGRRVGSGRVAETCPVLPLSVDGRGRTVSTCGRAGVLCTGAVPLRVYCRSLLMTVGNVLIELLSSYKHCSLPVCQ